MQSQFNRLFFALWPDAATRAAAYQTAQDLRAKHQTKGYLVKPERYHITLHFLGDYVPAEIETAALQAAGQVKAAPFTLKLDRAGCFRNRQIPCWLGPWETPPGMTALYQQLHAALTAAQITPERLRFAPHLTIIRDAKRPVPHTPITPVVWEIREFVLIRSLLQKQPAEYAVLARYSLAPGAPGMLPPV